MGPSGAVEIVGYQTVESIALPLCRVFRIPLRSMDNILIYVDNSY